MLSACAAKSGWVGVAGARLREARLISSAGKASLPPRKQKHCTLRGELMIYCGEMMTHLMIMLLTYLLMQNNYGAQLKER